MQPKILMNSILVVDDDIELLSTVQYILNKNKHNVIAISDCLKAVGTALNQQPDLVLLDINLGDCDGRNICRSLKVDYKISIPVLLFSANGHYAENIGDFGADGFIQKPFSSKDFINFIQSYL